MEAVARRLPALPLSEEEQGIVYGCIMNLPEGELKKLFPDFLGDVAVAAALKKIFLPRPVETPTLSALTLASSPLRPSKKQRASYFTGKVEAAVVQNLVNWRVDDTSACLNWLWLHLFGASEDMTAFLATTHERRYYPYALALVRAAGIDGQGRVEVAGEDRGNSAVPDIQVIIDGHRHVIPLDVKTEWCHGSVDDPDGIMRNVNVLEQLYRYVLKYNSRKQQDYTCLTAVIVRLQVALFMKFHVRKGPGNEGSLEKLEYAPRLPRGTKGTAAVAGMRDVMLLNIKTQLNNRFQIQVKWSDHSLETANLGNNRLEEQVQNTTFQDLLPYSPPDGFKALVNFIRTVAGECFDQTPKFVYESRDGYTEASEVLASGPKSCVLATRGGASVVKVSSADLMEVERRAHVWADGSGCEYLRKMVAYGTVTGAAPRLYFIELEHFGVPFARKHVSTSEGLSTCWMHASTALQALHSRKVFHRDIKPNNFIVVDHGLETQRLLLNDLDAAAHWDEDLSVDVGTPMFRSPLLGTAYCCRDDWLSLLLTFAYLMGVFPESYGTSAERKLEVISNLASNPMLPSGMAHLIHGCLSDLHTCCATDNSVSQLQLQL